MLNSITFPSNLESQKNLGLDRIMTQVLIYKNKIKEITENKTRGAKAENNGDNTAVAPMELKMPSVPK
jgi:hypothetical protein